MPFLDSCLRQGAYLPQSKAVSSATRLCACQSVLGQCLYSQGQQRLMQQLGWHTGRMGVDWGPGMLQSQPA